MNSLLPSPQSTFVAIDFETADAKRDSACSVGMVRVEAGRIVARENRLIRPPRSRVTNSFVHGITWNQVRSQPAFGELWPSLARLLEGAHFLVAHNASFDQSVLRECCRAAELTMPGLPFLCTVKLARQHWGLRPARLPDVCRHLGLPLRHHDALSDAEACARIMVAVSNLLESACVA